MFTISIGKANATCPDKVTLTSGMVKAVQVVFNFSEEWDGFSKIAIFSNGATTLDVSLDDENKCYIPHEVLATAGKEVSVGIYGCKGEGDDYTAIPTVKCSLGKVLTGADPSGEKPAEPTPTMLDELIIRVADVENDVKEIENAIFKDVDLTKVTTITEGEATVTKDEIVAIYSSPSIIKGVINVSGYCEIEAENTGIEGVSLYINGEKYESIGYEGQETTISFKGVVNEPIGLVCDKTAVAKFTKFVTTSDYELQNEVYKVVKEQALRSNVKNGTGEHSLQQTPKIDGWVTDNPYVIEYFKNPTKPEYTIIGELDKNGNVIIKTGAFGKYTALLSGYGQIVGEQSTARGRRIIVLGEMSHGEGTEVFVLGKYAHGEGNNVTVLGSGGHGEGMDTYVEKEFGHAEGKETQAIGVSAHAQNYQTIAKGAHSHAQNARTRANGECSTSMGIDTVADGYASFAGGNGSKAKANNAVALNGKTEAWSENSTAIGAGTQAFGRASLAGGHKTITRSNAQGSRTGGAFTIAGSQYQDVRGMFNVEDAENKFADIVGGGTSETARKNIYTLDWSGNGYFAGSVEGTSLILKSSTAGSNKRFKITVDDSGTIKATEIK